MSGIKSQLTQRIQLQVREEEEREARNAVKREQDLAFEMAQKADREKEEAKRREAEERLEQAKIEEAVRRSEEEAKVQHLILHLMLHASHVESFCSVPGQGRAREGGEAAKGGQEAAAGARGRRR